MATKSKRAASPILASVHEAASDLHQIGLVEKATKLAFDEDDFRLGRLAISATSPRLPPTPSGRDQGADRAGVLAPANTIRWGMVPSQLTIGDWSTIDFLTRLSMRD